MYAPAALLANQQWQQQRRRVCARRQQCAQHKAAALLVRSAALPLKHGCSTRSAVGRASWVGGGKAGRSNRPMVALSTAMWGIQLSVRSAVVLVRSGCVLCNSPPSMHDGRRACAARAGQGCAVECCFAQAAIKLLCAFAVCVTDQGAAAVLWYGVAVAWL